MKEIIFASTNANKVREINEMLEKNSINGINVKSLKDKGIDIEIDENGLTFAENALIKARAIAKLTSLPTLADDSGLSVDALDGAPGIYSSRFMGKDTPYTEKNLAIIEKLNGIEGEARRGGFNCAMALVLPDGREYVTEGQMYGVIAKEPSGENGFGYDPIVFLPEYGKTCAELTPDEKNSISHRGEALRKMIDIIKKEI